jgi:hypothetical protein
MSQLDRSAGTSGDAACMSNGSEKLAKEIINRLIGELVDPTIMLLYLYSNTACVNVIHQAKNKRDSYRLLKGK